MHKNTASCAVCEKETDPMTQKDTDKTNRREHKGIHNTEM